MKKFVAPLSGSSQRERLSIPSAKEVMNSSLCEMIFESKRGLGAFRMACAKTIFQFIDWTTFDSASSIFKDFRFHCCLRVGLYCKGFAGAACMFFSFSVDGGANSSESRGDCLSCCIQKPFRDRTHLPHRKNHDNKALNEIKFH